MSCNHVFGPFAKLFAVASLAVLLAPASIAPAAAYSIPASYVPGNPAGSYTSDMKSGSFIDAYSFTISYASDVSVSLSSTPFAYLTLTDLGIYDVLTNHESTTFTKSVNSNALGAGTDTVFLGAGDYYIGVKGSFSKPGLYNGILSVAAVPLPSTLALFGLAVLGLGTLGAVKRRTSTPNTSV